MFSIPPRDTSFITPNDKFYLVQYNGMPNLNVGTWRLPITGNLKNPLTLTYADFLSRPSVESMVTLACIDTLPGGGTIGNAIWQGTPLKDLLLEAGIGSTAVDVVFRAADGYSDSIPVDRVMQGDILLAHTMNGIALPHEHGYPLRVIAPGLYGIKNVKWLTEIEVVDNNFKGYWQQRGWTDEGHIKVISRIDYPGHYQDVPTRDVETKGIAFAGNRGIDQVEISMDSGKKWEKAQITHAQSVNAWVLWKYAWKAPKSGAYSITVRATDRNHQVQTTKILRAYPDGASGHHSITVLVR